MKMSGLTVIAVSGPPGSGKSTLSMALARRLPDAALIAHDDYETLTRQSPESIAAWLDQGGDPDRIEMDELDHALCRLVAGEAVRVPATGETLQTGRYLVFDTPFGRARTRSAPLIDLQIWLDVAPDVALARKVRQFTMECLDDQQPAGAAHFVSWLDQYLANYLAIVRRACAVQRHRVMPVADVSLDASNGTRPLVDQALAEMHRRGLWPRRTESVPAPAPATAERR